MNSDRYWVNGFVDIEKVLKSVSMVVLEPYSLEFPHVCIIGKKEEAAKLFPFEIEEKGRQFIMKHHEGELGVFDYDGTQFKVFMDTKLCYIGNETDGSKIVIPDEVVDL